MKGWLKGVIVAVFTFLAGLGFTLIKGKNYKQAAEAKEELQQRKQWVRDENKVVKKKIKEHVKECRQQDKQEVKDAFLQRFGGNDEKGS